MRNEKFFYRYPIIQTILFFIFLLLYGLLFFLLDCKKKSDTFIQFTQTQDFTIQSSNELSILVSSNTHNNESQDTILYNLCFINTTKRALNNWTITLEVQPSYTLEAISNADFSFFYTIAEPLNSSHQNDRHFLNQYKSDKNIIIAKQPNFEENHNSFYSTENIKDLLIEVDKNNPLEITQIIIRGKLQHSPFDDPLFYLFLGAIAVLILCLISFLIAKKIFKSKNRRVTNEKV